MILAKNKRISIVSLKATPVLWGKRPTDEMEQGKCLWSAGCLSKQELGGVWSWPLRARTSQSPSAKQQQTRQLTVGHSLLLCYACLQTSLTPLISLPLFSSVPSTRERVHSLLKGQEGERRRKRYHLADMICLECSSALLYLNKHVCDVRYNNGQMGRV